MSIIDGTLDDDFINGTTGDDDIRLYAGNDVAYALAGNDTLDGGDGDDFLSGGLGDDSILGGTGIDYANYYDATGGVTVDLNIETAQAVGGGQGNDLLLGIEGLLGSAYNDTLAGNADNNGFIPYAGNDLVHGGDGVDGVEYTFGDTGITVDLRIAGYQFISDFEGVDSLVSIENVLGSDYADQIAGNGAANSISGGLGNDTLSGGNGDDVLNGGDGIDTVSYRSAYGGVIIDLGIVGMQPEGGEGEGIDTLDSIENLIGSVNHDEFTGNNGNNLLRGGAGGDYLNGQDGNDTLDGGVGIDDMSGGAGNDVFWVDDPVDAVVELLNGGVDLVNSSIAYTLGDNVERLMLLGTANLGGRGNTQANLITGNAGNNLLSGLAANDTLNGGGGNDTLDGGTGTDSMAGGLGNDTYTVDVASDKVVEATLAGTDLVRSSVAFTLGNYLENLLLLGSANVAGTGNGLANILTGNSGTNALNGGSGNDTLSGNAGNDALNGGAGVDSMSGGAGSDSYVVDAAGDTLVEAASEGRDLVQSAIGFTLDTNFEDLTLTGGALINGTGNGVANVIKGNTAKNLLSGSAGNDTLDGGAGADTLNGGADSDFFVFSTVLGPGNIDTITGFVAADDTIRIDNAVFNQAGFPGALPGSAFFAGSAAHDASDRIIYNPATGALFYDDDGNDVDPQIQFATLATGLVLSAADFVIV